MNQKNGKLKDETSIAKKEKNPKELISEVSKFVFYVSDTDAKKLYENIINDCRKDYPDNKKELITVIALYRANSVWVQTAQAVALGLLAILVALFAMGGSYAEGIGKLYMLDVIERFLLFITIAGLCWIISASSTQKRNSIVISAIEYILKNIEEEKDLNGKEK